MKNVVNARCLLQIFGDIMQKQFKCFFYIDKITIFESINGFTFMVYAINIKHCAIKKWLHARCKGMIADFWYYNAETIKNIFLYR